MSHDAYIHYARMFGLISLSLSLGILMNVNDAHKMVKEMIGHSAGYIMGGVLPLIFGSFVVIEHNVWTGAWPMLVTLIGWLFFCLGLFRVMFPAKWRKVLSDHAEFIPILFSLFGMMVGFLLLYLGFIAPLHTAF